MDALRSALALALLAAGMVCGCRPAGPEAQAAEPLLWLPIPLIAGAEDPILREAVAQAAREMESSEWPDSRVVRTAPTLGEVRERIMPPAHSAVQEETTYQAVFFRDGLWGQAQWCCTFWPKHRRSGCVEVRLTLCPCCRAAKELILMDVANRDLPVPVTVALYFQPMEKLGNVAFGRVDAEHGDIRFVRDNIFVHVRTHGALAGQTEAIARKIDRLIRRQRRISYGALVRRRPVVCIPATDEGAGPAGRYVCCEVVAGQGRQIVCWEAWVNGHSATPKWLNLTVVTDDLLARSCRGLVEPAE